MSGFPWYSEDTPDQWGFTANPLGFGFTDLGMGLFLDGYYGAPPDLSWGVLEPKFDGKFQTSTARNAAQVPYAGFVKAYMHNGYLTSLKEVVHFYNTRDVYPYNVLSGHCPEGTIEKVTCWPMPEDPNNENLTIGKLGLFAGGRRRHCGIPGNFGGWLQAVAKDRDSTGASLFGSPRFQLLCPRSELRSAMF